MGFGNVNVAYKPCKSVGQLKSAEKYMLGKQLNQIKDGIVKTEPDLYSALGCCRDNFSNNILVTRKLHGKSYSKLNENEVLAHKMSISFHPKDNDKLNYRMAFKIAQNFADKFVHEKGHEVLFVVHTDSKHVHVHFLISNCNMNTGKAYRRNKKDLWEMSRYFGEQCKEHGLENSVREEFYSQDKEIKRDKITFAEKEMKKRGAETFKAELREVIQEEIQNPANKTFDDVMRALWENWKVETRVAGNTVSYRHPEHKNKNNELVSVRGSKLGEMYTRKGVEHELNQKLSKKERGHSCYINADSPATDTVTDSRTESELGITATESTRNASTDVNASGARPTGRRGQISSSPVNRNDEPVLRNLESFYERYRKPVERDEQESVENSRSATRVRNKGAR